MSTIKQANTLLLLSTISFFIMSVDFMFMPIGSNDITHDYRWLDIITGLLFWIGLIVGTVLFVIYISKCKKLYNENHGNKNVYQEKHIGLITFFSNKEAMIADVALLVSVVLFAILMIFTDRTSYICYISISILVFSFIMHCILNSKSFYVHQGLKKILIK